MKIGTLTNDVAIDLGTDNTRIYYKGNIIDEPSVIAYDTYDGTVVCIGKEAEEMIGRNPETVAVVKPISGGVITDFELACQMINGFLGKVIGSVLKPRVMVTVPCGITDVERRAVCDAIRTSEIRDVYVIEAPIAAAIGANCDVSLARGMMVVDIGGGKCNIAAISLGQAVVSRLVRFGGGDFTEAVVDCALEKHDMRIGVHTAEKIKQEVGCAFQRERDESVLVGGYNMKSRKPDQMLIHSEETREAFSGLIDKITAEIKGALDETPTELLGDIMEDGILLTGGGAALWGLARKLRIELGVKVFLAEEPQLCAARGAGSVMENMDKMQEGTYVFTKG